MIEEHGFVVSLEGEIAWVETQRKSACQSCALKKGCGTGVISEVLGKRRNRIKALNALAVQVGDQVVLGIQDKALIKGSFALYGVPLVSLLGFAFFGEWVAGANELFTMLFAGIGLVFGGWWLRWFSQRIARDSDYQPIILRVLR